MRRDLPSGTVTFLFTDVEGSTSLLAELGEAAYADALAEHRRVIREACAAEGGVEVDTQGDAFLYAFPTAPGALATAGALTERLAVDGPIRVRVGLHTGTPLLTEEGYVGRDLHRAARIAASGHGGQVLVSASTASLVETPLGDLGEHRFKDLGAPERVYQLGDGIFPPLKSLYASTLPVPATPFLGREAELAEAASLLGRDDVRLLTLTGPGGTGKTRLSLQAAADASDGFPDGVHWIPLAPLRDASLLETTVAQALGISEQPGVPLPETLVRSLASKRSLLVVDNCEHLAEEVAALVRALLEGCPSLVVVASSRERLGLRFEHVYPVPPMAARDGELLFRERALAVSPDFVADEHVAAICEAVDELPLAIELAAARVRSLSTQAIRERLGERLPLLASRNRDLEERQRTLEATIAWSYDLLDDEEQRVLRALSVFAGGCTLAAAEAVAGADLDLLESLLDKSLLRHRLDEAGQDRYWMLETIREYSAARLAQSGEADERAEAHRAFFVLLAAELGRDPGTPRSAEQFERFRVDRDNFRLALLGAIEAGDAESALQIVRYLGFLWHLLGEVGDSYSVAQRALVLQGGTAADRGYALLWSATYASYLGEATEARALLGEANSLFMACAETAGLAQVAFRRSFLESTLGDGLQGIAYAERAVALAREAGETHLVSSAGVVLAYGLALVALDHDPPDRAMLERAYEMDAAKLAELRALGFSSVEEADQLHNTAQGLTLLGRHGEALRDIQEAISLGSAAGRVRPEAILYAAFVAGGLAFHHEGCALAAWALRELNEWRYEMQALDRRMLERLQADGRAALGDGGYEAAVREGEAMTGDQAVELVLSLEADATLPEPA